MTLNCIPLSTYIRVQKAKDELGPSFIKNKWQNYAIQHQSR